MSAIRAGLCCVAFLATLVLAIGAQAGSIVATYEAPGVMTPNAASICGGAPGCQVGYETFNYVTQSQASQGYTSNFSSGTGVASPYSGTYSAFTLEPAGIYGGAGGTGNYAVVFGYNSPPSYTLNLVNNNTGDGVNYFGMWISALDAKNQLQFYDSNNTLIYTFTSQQLIADLGNCNNGHSGNAYCGNPASSYADSSELFVYVNFFDMGGTFSKIVFSEVNGQGAGFETDNHAVAYSTNLQITGTSVVPEPGSLGLLAMGLGALWRARRQHRHPSSG